MLEATLVGLGMALVLHERFAGRPLMRSLLLIPWSLSRVVVGLLWIGILDFEFGMLNGVLHRAGLIEDYIAFFKDGFQALNVLVSVYMWNQAPFATLLFLAGMQSIPEEHYMAAEVDGAGYWRRFWHVTLPALRPILFLVLVAEHRERLPDARPDLRPDHGRPRRTTRRPSPGSASRPPSASSSSGPGTAILYTLTAMCLLLTFVYHWLVLRRFQAEA